MRECRICGRRTHADETECRDCGNALPAAIKTGLVLPKQLGLLVLFLSLCIIIYSIIDQSKHTARIPHKIEPQEQTPVPAPAAAPQAPSLPAQTVEPPGEEARIEVLRAQAEKGDETAQYELGKAHVAGEGGESSLAEALRWYRLAADQGNLKAQVSLGTMFEQGTGVTVDTDEALRWYRLAAAGGSTEAQEALKRIEH